jgi:tRNA(fMet)-specific endonuclease VapC
MYCLDTNVVIAYLKGRPSRLLDRFEIKLARNAIALPAIALFELEYGSAKSNRRRENDERLAIFLRAPVPILPFDPTTREKRETSAPHWRGLERRSDHTTSSSPRRHAGAERRW